MDEYTVNDLERIIGYRKESEREQSHIEHQISNLKGDLRNVESRWRHWVAIEAALKRECEVK
jgi:hypothetical protein